jgi:dihydrolipoamide dehydrogenase
MKAKDQSVTGLTKGVEFLLKKNGVDYIKGAGSFVNEHEVKVALNDGGETTVKGKNILIATGSESTPFPGLEVDEKRVITSTGALSLEAIPETMVVIGGGIIGLEMASVWSRLGTKVTVVEFLSQIGGPGMDNEIAKMAQKILKKQGMDFKTGTKVVGGDTSGDKVKLDVDAAKGGRKETVGFFFFFFFFFCAHARHDWVLANVRIARSQCCPCGHRPSTLHRWPRPGEHWPRTRRSRPGHHRFGIPHQDPAHPLHR